MSYADKLRDPRWQRRRLEIMERDGFACRTCDSVKKTLNVHHTYYDRGVEPWDYPAHSLVTFCEDHHKQEGAEQTKWDWELAVAFRRLGATNARMERIAMMLGEIDRLGKIPAAALAEIEDAIDLIWQAQMPPRK